MGNYLGYGLQSAVQGFQTGFNMAQQKSEMDWQKKQRKLLESKQAKMLEVSSLWNAKIEEIYADKKVTEEESAQLITIYLSGGYEFMEKYKGAMDSIKNMSESKFNQELEWMDLFFDWTEGQDPNDLSGVYDDYERRFVTTEKSKALFEARRKITDKGYGIAKEEQIYKRGATIPVENRAEWFRQQGIEIPEAEVTPKEPTFNEKRFNWKIDQLKAGKITTDQFLKSEGMYIAPEKKTALESEINLMIKYGATNEEIKDKLLSKGATTTTEKPETVGTLKNWEKMFDVNDKEGPKTEEEYNRALDLLTQSEDKYKPKYATWKEALVAEVKGIGKELEGITDKTDRLFLLDVYKRKLEEIKAKYPDVDLNQFTKPKEMGNWDKFLEWVGF